jgi:ribonuclease H2 subunit B
MAQDLASTAYALQQQTLISGNIYEIQKLHNSSHHGSTANKFYGSYFVDSTVISDGNLYLCSMVDPLYFVLPFVSNTNKWMPLDQVVSTFSVPVQNSLCTYQLKNLMDFKQLGDVEDDLSLCRYNESKAVMWLKSKYLNCSDGIHKKMQQVTQLRVPATEDRNQNGAFAPGFVMDSDVSSGANKNSTVSRNNNSEELEVRNSANRYALQLLCEYLNELWRRKVMVALGFPDDYLLIHPKSPNSDTDVSPVITPLHESNDKKRKPVEPAKTHGQKKLAKVDTKGMKSLCSFFSSSNAKNRTI